MKVFRFLILTASAGLVAAAACAEGALSNVDDIRALMKTLCAADEGELDRYTFEADGEGNIQFKGIRPGIEGEINISRDVLDGTVEGEILIRDEELASIAEENVRDCMKETFPLLLPLIQAGAQ